MRCFIGIFIVLLLFIAIAVISGHLTKVKQRQELARLTPESIEVRFGPSLFFCKDYSATKQWNGYLFQNVSRSWEQASNYTGSYIAVFSESADFKHSVNQLLDQPRANQERLAWYTPRITIYIIAYRKDGSAERIEVLRNVYHTELKY